jgi:hypothetical protein
MPKEVRSIETGIELLKFGKFYLMLLGNRFSPAPNFYIITSMDNCRRIVNRYQGLLHSSIQLFNNFTDHCQSRSYFTAYFMLLYFLVSSPFCGHLTRYCFLFKNLGLKFVVLFLWGALSGERPCLSFVSHSLVICLCVHLLLTFLCFTHLTHTHTHTHTHIYIYIYIYIYMYVCIQIIRIAVTYTLRRPLSFKLSF